MPLLITLDLSSFTCTFLTRAPGQSSSPTSTPQPAPTSTASSLSASEEFQRALPTTLAPLDMSTLASDERDASDPAVAAFLAGTDPSKVRNDASVASGQSGVVFHAGAVRIPGRERSAALDALVTRTLGDLHDATGKWEGV